MIEAVVFDTDGVLCHYRRQRRLALLASWSGRGAEAIDAAIWRSGFEDEAERGLVSADDSLRGFGERKLVKRHLAAVSGLAAPRRRHRGPLTTGET